MLWHLQRLYTPVCEYRKTKQVKYFYDTFVNGERLWSIERVRNAVVKEWVTAEEFKEITGEQYAE